MERGEKGKSASEASRACPGGGEEAFIRLCCGYAAAGVFQALPGHARLASLADFVFRPFPLATRSKAISSLDKQRTHARKYLK